ncbi:MAG: polysaccharide deacetylase family protein [Bacteroidales bacterium]|nr:polysaccharide deacetylase family protein [Bacteroidales bacterium]
MNKILCSFLLFLILFPAACTKHDDPELEEPGKVIVLMYHRIVKGEATNLYERSLENLEADLMYLNSNNIKVISFADLGEFSEQGSIPEGNYAIITFDDGDSSWYTLVRQLLIDHNMKATFFLWTYMIGSDSFITWEEVENMSNYMVKGGERPFTFGSHSYSHSFLYDNRSRYATLAEYQSFLDYELGRSKEIIEQHTPGDVDVFSLPYGNGAGDEEIIAAAERNGYKFIRTSIWSAIDNTNLDLMIIPSLPMLDASEPDLIGYYLGISETYN